MTETEHACRLAYALRNVLIYPDSQSAKDLGLRALQTYFNAPHHWPPNDVTDPRITP